MSDSLFTTAPGFDQPLAVLKHCHDKIRKQIATMQNLLTHLPLHGATIDAHQAAQAVLRYFDKAAHLHHEDEEQNLMPMLQACAEGDDASLLATLVPEILADHRQMDHAWESLRVQLDAIANGSSAALSRDEVARFADAYLAHMDKEEGQLAPMAKRLFDARQMAQLGQAMQRRRGTASGSVAADSGSVATASSSVATASGSVATASGSVTTASGSVAADNGNAVAHLRKDYSQASLMEDDMLADPIAQFARWFDDALKEEVNEANAMSLATVGSDGKPTSRIVLVKQFDRRGFTWYTNYASQKGRQLAENPHAALLFFWRELERQVRIEGHVEKTSEAESEHYFHSRPLGSRLGAIASAQSAPVSSREALDANFALVVASNGEQPPRPPQWGGYRLVPTRIEFWQGRRSRFHDRIVFTLQADGSWLRERLQP